jgi:hypothetical protein
VVLERIGHDLTSPQWVEAALSATQRQLTPRYAEQICRLQKGRDAIGPRISRLLDMASELERPGPIVRKVDELERERDRIGGVIAKLAQEDEASNALASVSEQQILAMLSRLAKDMHELPRENLKDLFATMLDKVVLDPDEDTVQLHYRIALCRDNGASPRGFEPRLPP